MPRTSSRRVRPSSDRATNNEAQLALAQHGGAASATPAGAGAAMCPRRQSNRADRVSAAFVEAAGTATTGATQENEVVRGHASMYETAPVEPADGATGLCGQRLDLFY